MIWRVDVERHLNIVVFPLFSEYFLELFVFATEQIAVLIQKVMNRIFAVGICRGSFLEMECNVWLKPGKGPAPVWTEATPLRLDRGNLALLDERGLVLATSTQAGGLVEISYPDATRLADILERYRVWIIGGLWLLITLFVLGVFQRLYRRHNAPSAQDD